MYEISKSDLGRGRRLAAGAVASPLLLSIPPASITLLLLLLAPLAPPTAVIVLFFGMVATGFGLLAGLIISGILFYRRSKWAVEMRERIAADGIKAEEIEWFRKELKPSERRTLRSAQGGDPLMADAYRETLASRLTASRIIKSSRRQLQLMKRRQDSIKRLNSTRSEEFTAAISKDVEKLSAINEEAKNMLAEAEARLQMIEAAAARGGSIADSELALKKLSARRYELPLALEAAKIADEIRDELDRDALESLDSDDGPLSEN